VKENMRIVKQITTVLFSAGMFLCMSQPMQAQGTDPIAAIQQKLDQQFVPSVFNQDQTEIVTTGAVVALQKDGLLVFRLPVKYCPITTYKNGKLSQGFGDKVDVERGDNLGGIAGFMNFPQKILGFGEKVWILGFSSGKNTITAVIVTAPYEDGRYCGMLKLPYEKGHPPTPDEAVRMISEVLAPQPAQDQSTPDRGVQPVPGQVNDPIKAIQQRLRDTITQARLDGNGDIVAAGSVLTLKKDSLQMCATPNSGAPANAGAPANTYKNGKLSAGMFVWKLGLGISKIDPDTIPQRKVLPGEKFWVVNYTVKKEGVELKLWTDADSNNVRYWGWLEIPFAKNQIPPADDVMKTIAEVLDADAPAQAAPAAQSAPPPVPAAPEPPPPPEPAMAPIAPPPPPPAAPKTIALGQTKDEVAAILGQPDKVANLGTKEIDYYPDMKVVFVKGKVTDIQ
jgi:hypothetical protein